MNCGPYRTSATTIASAPATTASSTAPTAPTATATTTSSPAAYACGVGLDLVQLLVVRLLVGALHRRELHDRASDFELAVSERGKDFWHGTSLLEADIALGVPAGEVSPSYESIGAKYRLDDSVRFHSSILSVIP